MQKKLHFTFPGRAFIVWGAKNSFFGVVLAQLSDTPRAIKNEAARCVLSTKASALEDVRAQLHIVTFRS